ncbi:hypothetical protein FBY03_12539 [Pseudomonas sp. SJZ079]|uniref:hypothetical protein n=1 Tax=Pseudomonas sp. SJZ079 TaxID=2572887 RepID=UPI00119A1E3B|nr:hypothetical protein [Pseudomonas sp. SJZ079]TWC30215.1 hypothetical protein FBY03_12539 [Pseudomonas sp. SJZ079]
MKPVLRTFVAVFMFAGIFAGCLAILLLVILMVRFPPLILVVVLACWIYRKVRIPDHL